MKTNISKIFVFGASGHAKVIIDTIELQKRYCVHCVVDDNSSLKGTKFLGYPVVGGRQDLLALPSPISAIVAVGDNRIRCEVSTWLTEQGFDFATVVHPSAVVARSASIGQGSVLMAMAVINAASNIGAQCILNTKCSVDHDCVIGDGVHIAPGATLCGTVQVGPGSLIGAGATVLPNIRIGCNAIVGAGTTVRNDLADGKVFIENQEMEMK